MNSEMRAEIITNKDVLRAIEASAEHWSRMISYVKKNYDRSKSVQRARLRDDLGEVWYAEDCPLCRLFGYANWCNNCPVGKNDMPCNQEGSLWNKVERSQIWMEWLENAIRMRNCLECCLEYEQTDLFQDIERLPYAKDMDDVLTKLGDADRDFMQEIGGWSSLGVVIMRNIERAIRKYDSDLFLEKIWVINEVINNIEREEE